MFYAKALLFDKLYRLETYKLCCLPDQLRPFIQAELKAICDFFSTHDGFCQYYDNGSEYRDYELFTSNNNTPLVIDDSSLVSSQPTIVG